jgi:hypothetical protein
LPHLQDALCTLGRRCTTDRNHIAKLEAS